jgi:hypothetical protein
MQNKAKSDLSFCDEAAVAFVETARFSGGQVLVHVQFKSKCDHAQMMLEIKQPDDLSMSGCFSKRIYKKYFPNEWRRPKAH